MFAPHIQLDLSGFRRVLVAGDIHGHLDRLDRALADRHYDADAGDRLILLGDLIDRGPDTVAVHAWLRANPTVIHLLGNHDEMLLASLGLRPKDNWNNPYNHMKNGGEWIAQFADGYSDDHDGRKALMVDLIEARTSSDEGHTSIFTPDLLAFGRRLAQAPVAITLKTPGGRQIGLIHADLPATTWAGTVAALNSTDESTAHGARITSTWERGLFNRVGRAKRFGLEALEQLDVTVPDIDHIFFGHSIVDQPMTAGNLTWIDTGPAKGYPITVLDIDAFLEPHA